MEAEIVGLPETLPTKTATPVVLEQQYFEQKNKYQKYQ